MISSCDCPISRCIRAVQVLVVEPLGLRMTDTHPDSPARGRARDAILTAVVEIVAEFGIDAVTHRRVAARARVSPGTTSHHFASRDDLLHSVLRFYLARGDHMLVRIAEQVRDTSDDPIERVSAFLARAIDREFADERLVRAEYELLLYASGHEDLAAEVRAWDARWIGSIAGDLEAAGWPRAIENRPRPPQSRAWLRDRAPPEPAPRPHGVPPPHRLAPHLPPDAGPGVTDVRSTACGPSTGPLWPPAETSVQLR
jgi:AcrR family transcriptional regulator